MADAFIVSSPCRVGSDLFAGRHLAARDHRRLAQAGGAGEDGGKFKFNHSLPEF